MKQTNRMILIGLALASLCLTLPPLQAAEEVATDTPTWTVLEVRPADGEQCLVCGQAIESGDIVEVRYKGRRFHVAAKMLEKFENDPEVFFDSLEAHSALFDENSGSRPGATQGWLYFGIYVLIGLLAAAICGYLAVSRGMTPAPWFLAGLFFNVIALVALLASKRGNVEAFPAGIPSGLSKVPTTRAPSECGACGASHHPAASRCGSCGAALNPSIEPETARV